MKKTIVFRNKTFQIDIGFFVILTILWITSCFSLYNAFNLINDGSGVSYLIRQFFWYTIGFIAIFLLTSIQNNVIYQYVKKAYRYLMICLIYLFISGITSNILGFTLPLTHMVNGAISWFQIPLLGSFQPSEFIKIVLIVMCAELIQQYQTQHSHPTMADDGRLLLKIARIVIPPVILIFLQPDTGVSLIILFTIFVLVACSGIRRSYLVAIFSIIIAAIAIFFFLWFYHKEVLTSTFSAYRLTRIEAWLNPESYIRSSSNQLYTALLSLGSAGLTGFGLQANIVSIPEAHTDFIFAAIGQCFGLIGTTAIVFICLLLDLYLCRIALKTKNVMDRLIVVGVIAMLFYQQIQNLGMIIGLLPITGITLPLISYGGSSILSYFVSFAIVMNITPAKKRTTRWWNRQYKFFNRRKYE